MVRCCWKPDVALVLARDADRRGMGVLGLACTDATPQTTNANAATEVGSPLVVLAGTCTYRPFLVIVARFHVSTPLWHACPGLFPASYPLRPTVYRRV